MKITKEQFDKLRQLDRIEFRQKENKLYSYFEMESITNLAFKFFGLLTFVFILDIWQFLHNGHWFNISLYLYLTKLIGIFIGAYFVLHLVVLVVYLSERRKLFNEYFKVEIRK